MPDDQDFNLIDDEEKNRLEGQLKLIGLKHEVKKHDGLLTAEGKLVNYHEWHALVSGAGLIGLGHLYSGVFVLIYMLLMLKAVSARIFDKNADGLIGEISKELQYYIVGGIVVALIFMGSGHPPPEVPLSTLELLKSLLGA